VRSRGNELNKSALDLEDAQPGAEDSSLVTARKRTVLIAEFHQCLLYRSLATRNEPLRRSRVVTLELLVSISAGAKGAATSLAVRDRVGSKPDTNKSLKFLAERAPGAPIPTFASYRGSEH
jgi:hypothetical protein